MATKKKKVRSHVKRVKLQQKKNPVSQEKYEKRLKVARKKDFFRRLRNVIVILAIAFCALFAAGNLMLKKATGQTLIGCMREAKNLVDSSTPDTFRLAQTSYIYSDDGTQLAALAESEDATYLSYEDIPADVVNAFVSVEDRTFWNNSGVDYKGILRVCVNYVKTKGQVAEGASTITQQLARGTFLSNEKTLSRKIKEIFIARQLTKKYTKEQIMEFYCNSCCFANGIYGVEDASQKYFGRSVSDLSLSETAYICAIPNRPEYYNPLKNSENAISRRNKILQDMYECDYITKDAGDAALAENITVAEVSDEEDTFYNYEATYAINCAIRYLMKQDGFEFKSHFEDDADYDTYNAYYDEMYKQAKHKLYTGGYKVTTTMNLKAQKNLQKIFDKELAFNTKVDESTGIYQFQGAMTVIDNETGKVVAMIGGRSQDELQQTYSLNRGFQSFKQPGSSIKPLVIYTPALEEGYDANSTLTEIDVKAAKKSTSEKISKMSGKKMSLRYAVEDSKNGCAYSLYNIITPKVGLSYIENMNFSKIVQQDYTLSSGLGGLHHGTNTVEMANAYSTLENHGEYRQADCISSILDASGNEIYEEPESKMVYTRSASDQMTDILEGVLNSSAGTAKGLKWSSASDVAAAAKTGTTNDNNVAWFCGYTPYYTISVWVGYDYPKSVKGLCGNTYPAYIWKEAMLYMIDGKDEADFDLEGKKATGNKNVISDEDDSSAPEESTDTSVTNPDDAQNTTDTNPSGGDHSTDSSTDSTIDGNVPQGTEDISGGTISNSNKSESAGGSSESSSTGGESSGESDTTQ
ncbi:penicillin-binding protein [Eubacterium ramulus]|uniref:transglycosylase domain-containing protein n=1 Tax=Eubacterium ramulus TaxID=39490 RepID=UPI001020234D|nr:transglycosylase domain-containing protein [Eubacterium ramulus]MSC77060.1 penicillin-binding protein [Eubacterium ramulus]MSC93218.1 penicillin-binding protein [Eubacterium ramulus]RYS99294.1 penicillin-binding protein [Eubacterium ramulus]